MQKRLAECGAGWGAHVVGGAGRGQRASSTGGLL